MYGHYCDVIMGSMASQIIRVSIVYLTVCSGTDQRKYKSSASLAFVRGIHRWLVNSPHKGPVTRKIFPFHDVITEILVYKHVFLWTRPDVKRFLATSDVKFRSYSVKTLCISDKVPSAGKLCQYAGCRSEAIVVVAYETRVLTFNEEGCSLSVEEWQKI